MKRITIDIYDENDGYLKDMVEIQSAEMCLIYANFNGLQGMQCNFEGNTKEYQIVMDLLIQLNDASRWLNETYK